jgi:hypothetical protein
MRFLVALAALTLTMCAGSLTGIAEEHCMTGDSAICLADPECHWDGEKRGCYPGPAPKLDACAAHGGQSICESDTSLGCKWSTDKNLCMSAK